MIGLFEVTVPADHDDHVAVVEAEYEWDCDAGGPGVGDWVVHPPLEVREVLVGTRQAVEAAMYDAAVERALIEDVLEQIRNPEEPARCGHEPCDILREGG